MVNMTTETKRKKTRDSSALLELRRLLGPHA